MQVMANTFATRTAMQREHVEQPEHGENDADEQRLTPCLAISGAQSVEKSGISNLFIDFFCISIPCPGLSTPRTPPTRPYRDTSTTYGCPRGPRHMHRPLSAQERVPRGQSHARKRERTAAPQQRIGAHSRKRATEGWGGAERPWAARVRRHAHRGRCRARGGRWASTPAPSATAASRPARRRHCCRRC